MLLVYRSLQVLGIVVFAGASGHIVWKHGEHEGYKEARRVNVNPERDIAQAMKPETCRMFLKREGKTAVITISPGACLGALGQTSLALDYRLIEE